MKCCGAGRCVGYSAPLDRGRRQGLSNSNLSCASAAGSSLVADDLTLDERFEAEVGKSRPNKTTQCTVLDRTVVIAVRPDKATRTRRSLSGRSIMSKGYGRACSGHGQGFVQRGSKLNVHVNPSQLPCTWH